MRSVHGFINNSPTFQSLDEKKKKRERKKNGNREGGRKIERKKGK